jgi:Leucine-rich repeat (LRR) protein
MSITQCFALSPEIMKAIILETCWKVSRLVNKEWNELLSTNATVRITRHLDPFQSDLSERFFSRLKTPIIIGDCIHWSTYREDWIFQKWFDSLLSCLRPDCTLEIKRLELHASAERFRVQNDSLYKIVDVLKNIRLKSVQILTLRLFAKASKLSSVIKLLTSQLNGIEMIELHLEIMIDRRIDLAIYRSLAESSKFKGLHIWDAATLMPGFTDTLPALMDLQELNLSGIRIEDNEAKALASALTVLTHMQTLNLSRCNITATGATSLSSALSVLTTLQTLDLSGQNVDNAIWLALSALLPRAEFVSVSSSGRITVRSASSTARSAASLLDLGDSNDLGGCALRLAALLQEAAPPLLTSLNLGESGSSIRASTWSVVLAAVERCSHLDVVNGISVKKLVQGGLSTFDLVSKDPELATACVAYLRLSSSCLTSLDIRGTGIGVSGATALSQVLLHLTALQSLNLSRNQIRPAGGVAIASSLQALSALTFLDVSNNRLDSASAPDFLRTAALIRIQTLNLLGQDLGDAIWPALPVLLPTAATLSISKKWRITVKSAAADAGATGRSGHSRMRVSNVAAFLRASPPPLTSLELAHCRADLVAPLLSVLPFLTALQTLDLSDMNLGFSRGAALAVALTCITALKALNLQRNHVGPLAGCALGCALGRLTALRVLILDLNSLDPSAGRAIADSLTGLTSLRALSLADNELGDEVTARLRAEWSSLGTWQNGPPERSNDPPRKWPDCAAGLSLRRAHGGVV